MRPNYRPAFVVSVLISLVIGYSTLSPASYQHLGDVSRGAVMTSTTVGLFSHLSILNDFRISNIGMSITIADLIMSDGKRLENVGVTPDVPVLPTALALSLKTDPVLAYAAARLGAELTPEKAGLYYILTLRKKTNLMEMKQSDTGLAAVSNFLHAQDYA